MARTQNSVKIGIAATRSTIDNNPHLPRAAQFTLLTRH
jgi:hypothetical protein